MMIIMLTETMHIDSGQEEILADGRYSIMRHMNLKTYSKTLPDNEDNEEDHELEDESDNEDSDDDDDVISGT